MKIIRIILGLVIGLGVISAISEGIEFATVTAISGTRVSDPEMYFAIRNRASVLAFKFLYNAIAAFIGGYVAAWIAGRTALKIGIALAIAQGIALLWAMSSSDLGPWTPRWVWIGLVLTMLPVIIWGAWQRGKKQKLLYERTSHVA